MAKNPDAHQTHEAVSRGAIVAMLQEQKRQRKPEQARRAEEKLKWAEEKRKEKAAMAEAERKTKEVEEKRKREEAERRRREKQKNRIAEEAQRIINAEQAVVDELINNLVGGFKNDVGKIRKIWVPYKVSKYLVTQKEWETIMGGLPKSIQEKNPDFPVTNIRYDEAEEFVRKVNTIAARKGVTFLIPEDTWQWDYMITFAKPYADGKDDVSSYCWHQGNSGGHLHPVGQKKPSAGIYDACGLVFEWPQLTEPSVLRSGAYDEPETKCIQKLFKFHFSKTVYDPQMGYDNLGLRLISKDE